MTYKTLCNTTVTPENCEEVIENSIMQLVDLMAAFPRESKEVDPRAWSTLRIYMPKATEAGCEAALALFDTVVEAHMRNSALKRKAGIAAVIRMVETQVPDSWVAAETYRRAIAQVCEGWTLPDGARKVLEDALWNNTPQHTHRVASVCNEVVKSGAMCVDCGMLMSEADHA